MAHAIQLDIVTPTGPIFSESVDFLSVMGPEGSIGILPGHVPVFMTVDVGYLEYQLHGERDFFTTMGGILEFHNNHATVLTEAAEHARNIDEMRVQEAHKRAQSRLDTEKAGQAALDNARANASLQRASARLKVLELLKNRHNRRKI